MAQFVSINGEKVNVDYVRKYKVNDDGTVIAHVEREGNATTLTGDEATAFLAAVGEKTARPQAGLKEQSPAADK